MTTTTYRPDELIISGCRWARAQGIPNHKFSVVRVGDHAHVINCMFDSATLVATVGAEPGFSARVRANSKCDRCERATLSTRQAARIEEFRNDIERAQRNHADGYPFHIWLDGRLHDSALTHSDAFDECRAQRRAGFHGHMLIGSGGTAATITVSHTGEDTVRVELPTV